MMKKSKALSAPEQEKKNFSSFFNHASREEKRRLIEDVMRKANQDQRELVEQYEQAHQKPA